MVFGAAAIHGRLVHAALEAQRIAERAGGSGFQPRRFLKQALRALLDGEVAKNPRLNRGRLEAAVSLDDCLAKFFALSQGPPAGPWAQPPAVIGPAHGPPRDAQEYWIEVEDPPLAGRIDEVRGGTLVDFKTGEEDLNTHGEQLRLYAALWWLRFGEAPSALEVRYPGSAHALPNPDEDELREAVQTLRAELDAIGSALTKPPPQARPDAESCRMCPVRQLCGEYWEAPETRPLRTLAVLAQGLGTAPPIRDVELTRFPDHWAPGKSLIGVAEGANIGPCSVSLPRRLCPEEGAAMPASARLLQVLLLSRDDMLEVRTTNATEVFWKA
jgi:hypothetical protein